MINWDKSYLDRDPTLIFANKAVSVFFIVMNICAIIVGSIESPSEQLNFIWGYLSLGQIIMLLTYPGLIGGYNANANFPANKLAWQLITIMMFYLFGLTTVIMYVSITFPNPVISLINSGYISILMIFHAVHIGFIVAFLGLFYKDVAKRNTPENDEIDEESEIITSDKSVTIEPVFSSSRRLVVQERDLLDDVIDVGTTVATVAVVGEVMDSILDDEE